MRILILHSRYLSGWASGENSVVRDEERLLTEAGHDVVSWTPSPGPEISPERLGLKAMWSSAAVKQVGRLIERHRPQIVHCHNLYPMLSPAVLRAATRNDSKVVVTLHNYRMFCLPATCLRGGDICELCLGRVPWRGADHCPEALRWRRLSRCTGRSAASIMSLCSSPSVISSWTSTYRRALLRTGCT